MRNNKLYLNIDTEGAHGNDASPAPDTDFFIAHRFADDGEPEILIGHKEGDSYNIAVILCTQDCRTLVNRMSAVLDELDAGTEPAYGNPTTFHLPSPVSPDENDSDAENEQEPG